MSKLRKCVLKQGFATGLCVLLLGFNLGTVSVADELSINIEERAAGIPKIRRGRYLIEVNHPQHSQERVLETLVQIRYPPEIKTVGQAVEVVLQGTGFTLTEVSGTHARTLFNSALPQALTSVGPVSIQAALHALSGPQWDLVMDPVNKLITFELMDDWRGHFSRDGGALTQGSQTSGGNDLSGILTSETEEQVILQFQAGSLKDALIDLSLLWGWTLLDWEKTLQLDGQVMDWHLHKPWQIKARSFEEALAQVLLHFGLRAELHQLDRIVTLHRGK